MEPTAQRTASSEMLEKKKDAKLTLQEELGWIPEDRMPLICIPTGVSDTLGGALLKEVLPGLLELSLQIVILGKGGASYGEYMTKLSKEHRNRIAILSNDGKNMETMLTAADMALFLCDPTALPEFSQALKHGAIPVCPHTDTVENYDPNAESGEAFMYEKTNAWHCFAAMVRALETFRFPFDWKTIQRHGMQAAE